MNSRERRPQIMHAVSQEIGAILIVLLQFQVGVQEVLQHLVAFEAHLLGDLVFETPGFILRSRVFDESAEKHRIHGLQDEMEPADCGPAPKKLQMTTGNQKNTWLFGVEIVPLRKRRLSGKIPEEQIRPMGLFIRCDHAEIPSAIAEPEQYFSAQSEKEPIARNQPNS